MVGQGLGRVEGTNLVSQLVDHESPSERVKMPGDPSGRHLGKPRIDHAPKKDALRPFLGGADVRLQPVRIDEHIVISPDEKVSRPAATAQFRACDNPCLGSWRRHKGSLA